MKLILCIFLATLLTVISAPPIKTTATLQWDYPADEVTNVRFNIYFSTNFSTPINLWSVITNVAGTNVVVPIAPGNGFWFATATNEFGESSPSNTVTSTVPRNVQGTKIK